MNISPKIEAQLMGLQPYIIPKHSMICKSPFSIGNTSTLLRPPKSGSPQTGPLPLSSVVPRRLADDFRDNGKLTNTIPDMMFLHVIIVKFEPTIKTHTQTSV